VSWKIILSNQAVKDAKKIARLGYKAQAENLLQILADDPFKTLSSYEKLIGNLSGFHARHINTQHRIIYRVMEKENTVHVLRMWTHYE